MPPKNPDLTTSAPTLAYSVDESNWRTLRDVINSSPLKPSLGPSICNGTPADFILHITMAHTCGLTSGISGTPTLSIIIKLPNTTTAQECQWAYYAQELQYGLQQRFQTLAVSNSTPQSHIPPRQPAPKSRAPNPFNSTQKNIPPLSSNSPFCFKMILLDTVHQG